MHPTPRTLTPTLAAWTVAALCLALAACGGGGTDPEPQAAGAADTAAEAMQDDGPALAPDPTEELEVQPPAAPTADEQAAVAEADALDAELVSKASPPLFPANQWMRHVPDLRRLSDFSMPGTHDSGALRDTPALPGTAKAQVRTISEQLNLGVRVLDLRFKVRDYGKPGAYLQLFHGPVDQQRRAASVLGDVVSFLRAHPSETVVVSIKNEDGKYPYTFERLLAGIIGTHASEWWTANAVPTLGQVRGTRAGEGKLVLVRRFDHVANGALRGKGIDATAWKDNTRFQAGVLDVDDHYDFTCASYWNGCNGAPPAKWTHVSAHLDAARTRRDGDWYWTFASATMHNWPGVKVPVLGAIPAFANYENPRIASKLANQRGNYGVILMDRVTTGLAQAVISTND